MCHILSLPLRRLFVCFVTVAFSNASSRLIGSAGKVGVSCYMWWTIINSVCWLDGDKPSFLSVNLHWLSLTRRRTWYWSGLKPVSGPSLSPGPGWRLKYIYFFIEHWLGGQDQVCCQKVAGSNPNFAVVFWGRTKNDFAGDKGPIKWWIFQLILFLITILLLWFGGSF